MGVAENKQTVRTLIAAMSRGTIEQCRDLVTDDLVTRIPVSGEKILGNQAVIRGAGPCLRAKASIRGNSFGGDIDFKVRALVGEEEWVAAFLEMSAVSFRGEPYTNDYVFLFRFRGDKIAEWDAYMDTARVYEQFGFKIGKA